MRIEDGKGSGIYASVTKENRIEVSAVTEAERDHAGDLGDKYNINTGDITLTDALITTVLYIKNNEDVDLVITSLIYNLGNSTSGSGDAKIEIIKNPTSGDIITNANNVEINDNQNFGSSKTLTVDAFKGATSESVIVGGNVSVSTRAATHTGRINILLTLVIPKGSSLAINYTPPASNTSQICQFLAPCFLKITDV